MNEYPPANDPLEGRTDHIAAGDIDEYFFRLASKQIQTLTLNGFNFVNLRSVETDKERGLTRVVCDADDGTHHEFIYSPASEDQGIIHSLIDSEEPL